MEAYIARQPIFNGQKRTVAYELLYRDSAENRADFLDGDQATRRLMSDAITLFGLPNLTDYRPAYINFTSNLILTDFAFYVQPGEVVVELLETLEISQKLLEKLAMLKAKGYILALDDYIGSPQFDCVLPYVDVLKVDFRQTTRAQQRKIAQEALGRRMTLLAEKVESEEEFRAAAGMGYSMYQGYFFQQPRLLMKKVPSIAATSYGRILRELQKPEIDLGVCAQILHADAVLTYRLMQKVQTLRYYRGTLVTAIRQALVYLGTEEFRRWIILQLARENNVTYSDETVRRAYLRGLFVERLVERSDYRRESESGFLLGLFSLLDVIMGMSMESLTADMELPPKVTETLLGGETELMPFLRYVVACEQEEPLPELPQIDLDLTDREIGGIYMQCIVDTDKTFGNN